MANGTLRAGLSQMWGDGGRWFSVLSIVASIATAAWYLDDRNGAKAAREASIVEARLEKLDARIDVRIDELARSVDAVNRRLDRLLELQLEMSAQRRP